VAARTCIQTPHAPAAVGPYSQAVIAGDKVFLSGQIPLDPTTGKLVEGDIIVQTRRVLDNVRAVLEAAGSSLAEVCKTTVFVTDLKHFAELNRTYAEYFSSAPPARSTVQVAALPLGASVEIEVIASVAPGSVRKTSP
jgi:2-iminobutanoate/2-iminopropanoate deaminase